MSSLLSSSVVIVLLNPSKSEGLIFCTEAVKISVISEIKYNNDITCLIARFLCRRNRNTENTMERKTTEGGGGGGRIFQMGANILDGGEWKKYSVTKSSLSKSMQPWIPPTGRRWSFSTSSVYIPWLTTVMIISTVNIINCKRASRWSYL